MAIHVDSRQQPPNPRQAIHMDSLPDYLNRKETSLWKKRLLISARLQIRLPAFWKRYCRKVYELGYVPICPKLNDGQYLALDSADEKNGNSRTLHARSWAGAGCWWCAARRSATPCPQKSGWPKRGTSSAPHWMVWPESRKLAKTMPSDLQCRSFLSQPVTGFASIAFGYPKAFLGSTPNPRLPAIG